jgi:hypothetical protein
MVGYCMSRTFQVISQSQCADLVRQAYVPTRPLACSLAISTSTLQIYQVIRRHCSSFSVEMLTKTLCSVGQVRCYDIKEYVYSLDAAGIFPTYP